MATVVELPNLTDRKSKILFLDLINYGKVRGIAVLNHTIIRELSDHDDRMVLWSTKGANGVCNYAKVFLFQCIFFLLFPFQQLRQSPLILYFNIVVTEKDMFVSKQACSQ